jgi:hypothetical protein
MGGISSSQILAKLASPLSLIQIPWVSRDFELASVDPTMIYEECQHEPMEQAVWIERN